MKIADPGTGLPRRYRDRRCRMGFYLSVAVGREKGREPPRIGRESGAGVRGVDKTQRSRREQVERSLKDLETRRQKESRVPLSSRLAQAGLTWSTQKYS